MADMESDTWQHGGDKAAGTRRVSTEHNSSWWAAGCNRSARGSRSCVLMQQGSDSTKIVRFPHVKLTFGDGSWQSLYSLGSSEASR
jgi:hypothetical protein